SNAEAMAECAATVLAVKPQVMRTVAEGLAPALDAHPQLVISIAAGIREADLDRWLGGGRAIVRCMPNTPALVRSGASGLHANARVSDAQRELAEHILRAVGLVVWVEQEAQIDAVTAVSGSGPAYFFLVMEAMTDAGERLGLERETARLLTLETALGAARLALESGEDVATLRERVTSKGGTTEAALRVLTEGGLPELFDEALKAAARRAAELADQLGADDT
ncbi:MAG: pyrroline-5-carboxylate reductase, partial [Gammaproteobacteria bacterium]